MVESLLVVTNLATYSNLYKKDSSGCKIVIEASSLQMQERRCFDIIITFKAPISKFRNHDFTWVNGNSDQISAAFSPKIVKLGNGQLVQANINCGIWEIKKENPKSLYWRFNPQNAAPLTEYRNPDNAKIILPAHQDYDFSTNPSLLFGANAFEFSRSAIAFSAVACFTDHCDYDTAESIKLQRQFFKKNGIKVTKGFFINHFSKRSDNASFENDSAELELWKKNGHELAYHSLSQSIKHTEESFDDFKKFTPPFPVPTWIDHGYQPYNFSLFRSNNMPEKEYENILKSKNIDVLWNYTDSGTAAKGVINQLNPRDFTLRSFNMGNRHLKLSRRISLMIKNIMFHYYADEDIILSYKNVAANFKKLAYQKQLKSLFPLLRHFFKLGIPILKVLLFWNSAKNKPYKLAKYTPVIFRHTISREAFFIFQTLEMVDFINALHPDNIDKLVQEKGLFIAHTYFAAPMNYHYGRMFKTPDEIDEKVGANFANLGLKIKDQMIWNPTLIELVDFFIKFGKIVSDVDTNGNSYVANAEGVPYRMIH